MAQYGLNDDLIVMDEITSALFKAEDVIILFEGERYVEFGVTTPDEDGYNDFILEDTGSQYVLTTGNDEEIKTFPIKIASVQDLVGRVLEAARAYEFV